MTAATLKARFVQVLAATTDAILCSAGFTRAPKSVKYVRSLPDASQVFEISLAANPSYRCHAIAHIYPHLRLSIPEVSRIAEQLVDGEKILLANAPDILVNRPLEHFMPREKRVQWYAFEDSDFALIAREVGGACLEWGVPFFDDYRNAIDLVRGFEEGDRRPRLQENWAIFIASAYVCIGKPALAAQAANAAFASPGSQKKYAVVLENLERILCSDRKKG